MLTAWDKHGFGNFTIIRREDLVRIGTCGLFVRDGLHGVDLGFALLSEYEGKGYAYEAASRIKKAAFEDFHLPELLAIVLPDNNASLKLLHKLGFQLSGTTKLPGDKEKLLLLKAVK
jgi:RimJ/RimL family protein N-acetyltransferase